MGYRDARAEIDFGLLRAMMRDQHLHQRVLLSEARKQSSERAKRVLLRKIDELTYRNQRIEEEIKKLKKE